MIDGLHGSQYFSSRNLCMTLLDFEHGHVRVWKRSEGAGWSTRFHRRKKPFTVATAWILIQHDLE